MHAEPNDSAATGASVRPAFYRKRPVVIEAVQWTGDNFDAVWGFLDGEAGDIGFEDTRFLIPTLEGVMTANVGDFVIRGVQGEFYPCKSDIFAATYEAVGS